ncbi:hypothetical protein V6N13_036877 [Hibiscus sabdariffa]|uniref:Uncharacterized protein n=2 Tax=Hibiscus sabdariffa TaxID=183260 RepID=A0ABR2S5K9_9ROSI
MVLKRFEFPSRCHEWVSCLTSHSLMTKKLVMSSSGSFTRALDKGYMVDFMSTTWISLTLRSMYPKRGDVYSPLVTGRGIFLSIGSMLQGSRSCLLPIASGDDTDGRAKIVVFVRINFPKLSLLLFSDTVPRLLMFQWCLPSVHALVAIDANIVKRVLLIVWFSYVFSGPLRF